MKILGAGAVIGGSSVFTWSQLQEGPTDGGQGSSVEVNSDTPETEQQMIGSHWPSPSEADVVIDPAQDLSAVLNDTPPRSRIWLSSGTHALTKPRIKLKTGQHLATHGGELLVEYNRPEFSTSIKVEDNVIVDGLTLNGNNKEVNGLDIWGDNCIIRSCEIKNFLEGRYPLNVYKANNVKIVSNYFHHNKTRGCAVSGALQIDEWTTDCLIMKNRFEHNRTGVKLRGARNCVVRDNWFRITDEPNMNDKRGILLQAKDHPNQDNEILRNFVQVSKDTSQTSYCLFLSDDRNDSTYETKKNVIRGNRLVGGNFTIYVNNSAMFRDSTVINPGKTAVLIGANANVTFEGGSIRGDVQNRGGEIRFTDVKRYGKIPPSIQE